MSERNRLNLLARWGASLLILLFALALAARVWLPDDPNRFDLSRRLAPPSWHHPLGTDNLGRCVASRVLAGAGLTLGAGVLASLLAFLPGLLIGLAAGMMRGRFDAIAMGLVDVALAFPGLVLALVLAGFLQPSLASVVLGLALAGWPWWARFVRGLVLVAREKEYVMAAVALGIGPLPLMVRYILPQLRPPLLVALAMRTGAMLAAVSGLSYLGLGAQPPAAEWGRMLDEARMHLSRAPWLMIGPGVALSLAVAGFNLLAEGLRDHWAIRRFRGW